MIKLTDYENGKAVWIHKDQIGAIVELEKTDKHKARTRIDGCNSHNCYLVKETAAKIRTAMNPPVKMLPPQKITITKGE